ncbi:hypothetical protein ACWC3X_32510 [Streptomyces populi]
MAPGVGIEPPGEGEASAAGAPRSQDARWAAHLSAAREGHLIVSRKAVEIVDGIKHKLGARLDNTRRRAAKPSPQRRKQVGDAGAVLMPRTPKPGQNRDPTTFASTFAWFERRAMARPRPSQPGDHQPRWPPLHGGRVHDRLSDIRRRENL